MLIAEKLRTPDSRVRNMKFEDGCVGLRNSIQAEGPAGAKGLQWAHCKKQQPSFITRVLGTQSSASKVAYLMVLQSQGVLELMWWKRGNKMAQQERHWPPLILRVPESSSDGREANHGRQERASQHNLLSQAGSNFWSLTPPPEVYF